MTLHNGMTVGQTVRLYRPDPTTAGLEFMYASHNMLVHEDDALPGPVADQAKTYHPRGIRYRVPGAHRAIAHLIDHPHLTATGFAALAVFGLPFLTDGADTVLTGSNIRRKQTATATTPGLIRSNPDEVWEVHYRGFRLRTVPPAVALAQALALVRSKEVGWRVAAVPSLAPETTRAIQLLDATRHFLHIDPVELLAASRQRIQLPWLVSALIESSTLAESPKETEMRLLAKEIARRFKLTLVEQFVLRDSSGKPITRFDLAFVELKIGLMYDGAQHWEHERRHKDTKINLEAAALDWQVLRFSAWTLEMLIPALEKILTARGLPGSPASA